MRNQVRKFILGAFLVAVVSTTAPAMAATTTDGSAPDDFFTLVKNVIARLFDTVELKATIPPA